MSTKCSDGKYHRFKAEYMVRQYYEVVMDENELEVLRSKYASSTKSNAEWIDEWIDRLHGMFQAIMSNAKLLGAVTRYQVACEHQFLHDDGTTWFLRANYGKDISLPEILMKYADSFTQEDKKWLQEVMDTYKIPSEERDYDLEDLSDLAVCFKVEPLGWNMGLHKHDEKGK